MTTTTETHPLPVIEAVRQDELVQGDVIYFGHSAEPSPSISRRAIVVRVMSGASSNEQLLRVRDVGSGGEFTLFGAPYRKRIRQAR